MKTLPAGQRADSRGTHGCYLQSGRNKQTSPVTQQPADQRNLQTVLRRTLRRKIAQTAPHALHGAETRNIRHKRNHKTHKTAWEIPQAVFLFFPKLLLGTVNISFKPEALSCQQNNVKKSY